MTVIALRLMLKVWKRGGINLIQNDIYYGIDENWEPQSIFKDGLEFTIGGSPIHTTIDYQDIVDVITFSGYIYESVYHSTNDTYTDNYYNLSSTDWDFNIIDSDNPYDLNYLDKFWLRNSNQTLQGYHGSQINTQITIFISYTGWYGCLSKTELLEYLGVYWVGFYIKNPVFSTNDLDNPVTIQKISNYDFYLNPTFYTSVNIDIQK